MDTDPFVNDDFPVYVYCFVKLSYIDKTIYYRTEDHTLRRGDHVIIPKPRGGGNVTGEIVSVEPRMRFFVQAPIEETRVIGKGDA